MRLCLARIGRGGACRRVVEGRIGKNVMPTIGFEAHRREVVHGMSDIALGDGYPLAKPVAGDVRGGEPHQFRLQFDSRHLKPAHTGGKAETGHTDARARLQRPLALPGGHGGCQQHSIQPRPVALGRLQDFQPAVQKAVIGGFFAGRSATHWNSLLSGDSLSLGVQLSLASSRIFCALPNSSSATMIRLGRIPNEPSTMLVWLSNSKGSMPSSRSLCFR